MPRWLGFFNRPRLLARAEEMPQLVEEDVNDRGGVEGERLAQNQAAYQRNTQGPAKLRADACSKGQRNAAEQAAMVVMMIGRKRSRLAS